MKGAGGTEDDGWRGTSIGCVIDGAGGEGTHEGWVGVFAAPKCDWTEDGEMKDGLGDGGGVAGESLRGMSIGATFGKDALRGAWLGLFLITGTGTLETGGELNDEV